VALALAPAAEDHVQRLVVRSDGAPGRGGVRRLRIVHEEDAVRVRNWLEAVCNAREGLERLRGPRVVDAERASRRARRRGVLAIVRTGNQRLSGKLVGRRELDPPRLARDRFESTGDDGDGVLALVLEDPQLRVGIRLERAVTVEMIRLEVEQYG